MALQVFGEAIWNFSRVAPVAFLNQWGEVLSRCFAEFFDLDSASSSKERAIMEKLHEVERAKLRSPIWTQMALLRSMQSEVLTGSGVQTLTQFVSKDELYKIKRHNYLQRTIDAMTIAFDRNPLEVNEVHSYATVENKLLLRCVQQMISRRNNTRAAAIDFGP